MKYDFFKKNKDREKKFTWKGFFAKVLRVLKAILTPIICISLAFVIWSISFNESTDSYDRVFSVTQLSVNGISTLAEKSNLSVIEAPQVNLEITVSGLRKDVVKLTGEDLSAYIDVGNIRETGTHSLEISVNQLPGVRVVSITPATVDVQIDEIKTVPVNVIPQLETYSIESSYRFGSLKSETKTVSVSGPASVIDRIAYVKAEVNLGEISTSMVCMAKLVPMTAQNVPLEEQFLRYVTLPHSAVRVEVPLLTEQAVPLGVTYSPAIDADTRFTVTFSKDTVRVTGDPKLLADFEVLNVLEIGPDTFGTYQVRLADLRLPDGITLVTPDESVSVTVTKITVPVTTEPEETTGSPESATSGEPTETEPVPTETADRGLFSWDW